MENKQSVSGTPTPAAMDVASRNILMEVEEEEDAAPVVALLPREPTEVEVVDLVTDDEDVGVKDAPEEGMKDEPLPVETTEGHPVEAKDQPAEAIKGQPVETGKDQSEELPLSDKSYVIHVAYGYGPVANLKQPFEGFTAEDEVQMLPVIESMSSKLLKIVQKLTDDQKRDIDAAVQTKNGIIKLCERPEAYLYHLNYLEASIDVDKNKSSKRAQHPFPSIEDENQFSDEKYEIMRSGWLPNAFTPCSLRCATGQVPNIQCTRCQCLYHAECVGLPPNISYKDFICLGCEACSLWKRTVVVITKPGELKRPPPPLVRGTSLPRGAAPRKEVAATISGKDIEVRIPHKIGVLPPHLGINRGMVRGRRMSAALIRSPSTQLQPSQRMVTPEGVSIIGVGTNSMERGRGRPPARALLPQLSNRILTVMNLPRILPKTQGGPPPVPNLQPMSSQKGLPLPLPDSIATAKLYPQSIATVAGKKFLVLLKKVEPDAYPTGMTPIGNGIPSRVCYVGERLPEPNRKLERVSTSGALNNVSEGSSSHSPPKDETGRKTIAPPILQSQVVGADVNNTVSVVTDESDIISYCN